MSFYELHTSPDRPVHVGHKTPFYNDHKHAVHVCDVRITRNNLNCLLLVHATIYWDDKACHNGKGDHDGVGVTFELQIFYSIKNIGNYSNYRCSSVVLYIELVSLSSLLNSIYDVVCNIQFNMLFIF